MAPDFADRYAAVSAAPLSLQVLLRDPLALSADALSAAIQPYLGDQRVTVELIRVADDSSAAELVSAVGPPVSVVGLIEWGPHRIKLAGFDAPMPYGPIEVCVGPAMIAPPLKHDAKHHVSHVLLYDGGNDPDPLERYVALGLVAGAVARADAIVVMNEEARAAVQAIDLIPDEGEDILKTLRQLPLPLLYTGFVKMDVGDPERPWVRTFAAHRFGLPDLALHLTGHDQTSDAFRLFAGLQGYLRQTRDELKAEETLDLGDGRVYYIRAATPEEWYLESDGVLLVIEPMGGETS